ncbi:MAG: hypothetical protein NWE93_07215 [Candidatus Bathyarchaeota archaeon]|nr:hypothetical protein [Candidatus Bathyarchaeota archaeon]
MAGTTFASSIATPSVPTFTLAFIDKSYDVLPTTTVDPYNGQNITVDGYHVKASAIEIHIKNEAFSPFTADSGAQVNYYYNIRWKGHFEDEWISAFAANYGSGFFPRAAGSETVFSTDGQYTCGFHIPVTADFSPGDQIDFQVQAMIGYIVDPGPFESEVFEGKTSGWSSTQTLKIPKEASATTSTPTSTATETPDPSAALQNPTEVPARPVTESDLPFGLDLRDFALVLLAVLVPGLFLVLWVMRSRIRGLERKQSG